MATNTLYPLFPLGHINVILLEWMEYKELKSAPSSPGAGKSVVMDQSQSLWTVDGPGYSQLNTKWNLTEICRPLQSLREAFGTRGIDEKPVCKLLFGKIKTPLKVIRYLGVFSIHSLRKTSPAMFWRKINIVCKRNLCETLVKQYFLFIWFNWCHGHTDSVFWEKYFWDSQRELEPTKIRCRFLLYLW